ncbi:S8 family serine peptidase [Hydrogenimonas cancrithermarum]|uniref:Fervidolysin-like N-terminal prodomain domain-containing protein n=1 Tax=Hydrogenimonas cancrithermarum TaxID=2993563 RepID=A0ABM8FM00_9BACT|nr:hypothetical protein [Hydrogenimonas cancrithermarum]BDY13389.1 hypothetical protein HCR_17010 [Hydrogenimonas cancrithermarum]
MRYLVTMAACTVMLFAGDYYYMEGGKRVELTPVTSEFPAARSLQNVLKFKNERGADVAIPNRLIVKFKSPENFDRYLKEFGLKLLHRYRNGTCLLQAPTPKAAMDAANALSQREDVLFAQPDLIKKWSLR